MQTQILENLEKALLPYQFYWEEWISNGNCSLNQDEISIIEFHMRNKFQVLPFQLLDQVLHYEKVTELKSIINKLSIGEGVFREFVVVDFLSRLINISEVYVDGKQEFLLTPIRQLKITEELKMEFQRFNIISIGHLVSLYKPDEFSRGLLYKHIVAFQTSVKKWSIMPPKISQD